jgi:lysophospholipase L1-like esterase
MSIKVSPDSEEYLISGGYNISQLPNQPVNSSPACIIGINSSGHLCNTAAGGGGSGTVTSITATPPNLTGGVITGTGSIGLNPTVTGLTALTTTQLTASTFVQPSAPLLPASWPFSLYFFGDSITAGTGASSAATRWTKLVCNALGATELNFGVGGDQWIDAAVNVYNTGHLLFAGVPSWLAYGTNDLFLQTCYQDISRTVECLSVYMALLATTHLKNSRTMTTTGTWVNNTLYAGSGAVGIVTLASTGTVSTTVTGRYIFAGFSILNDATPTSCYGITVTIDGVTVNTALPLTNNLFDSTNNISTGLGVALYFYDLGTPGIGISHTVVFSFATIGGYTSKIGIDWVAGFDTGLAGTSPVFINAVPEATFPTNTNNTYLVDGLNNVYRDVSRKFQSIGIPIYFCFNEGKYGALGMTTADLVHPNDGGHAWIARNVLSFLSKGQLFYLNS